jgi:hypothetical protein
MATRRGEVAVGLSADDVELLLCGPHACGLAGGYWHPRADHARLRQLWAVHGPAVEAEAARRGVPVWFHDRDAFVRALE